MAFRIISAGAQMPHKIGQVSKNIVFCIDFHDYSVKSNVSRVRPR
jgi:hypothetical protein